MKSYSTVLAAQKKITAAVFGIFFAAALLFCRNSLLFQPLRNEFGSFLFIAAALLFFSLAFLVCPGRRKKYFIPVQFLFVIVLFLLLYYLTWKNLVPRVRILLLLAASGWIAGMLRAQLCSPVRFSLAGCGGALAGLMTCWFLSIHPGFLPVHCLFPAALAVLLWIAIRLIGHRRDLSAAGKVVLMILWLLPVLRLIFSAPAGTGAAADRGGMNGSLRPVLLAEAGLQPAKKDLHVLLIGDDRKMLEMLSDFPLVRKLSVLTPKAGYDLSRRISALPDDFDLILLQLPLPESFYAERFYRADFYRLLKERLQVHGTLAVSLPEELLRSRKKYIPDGSVPKPAVPGFIPFPVYLYGTAGSVLKHFFRSVKPTGIKSLMILCSETEIVNSPAELNRRAKELLSASAWLPEGIFLMNTPEEIGEQEKMFLQAVRRADAANDPPGQENLMWNTLLSHPAVDRSGIGLLLEMLRYNLLYVLGGLVFMLAVVRYFNSGALEKKRNWLSVENGTFTGLVLVLLLTAFQQITGRLCTDWHLIFSLVLLTFFCGLLASADRHHSPLLLKLLLGLTLLLPLCALAFLNGYQAEPVIFYLLTGYAGYTAGMLCGDLRSELSATLPGISLGLVLGMILCWLPGGTVFAAVLAILLRLAPITAENLRKQFEKCKSKYNIYR